MNNLSLLLYHCDTIPVLQSRANPSRNENSSTAEREPAKVPQVPPPRSGGEVAPEEPAGNRDR